MAVQMPPLPKARKAIYDYYKLEFLPDGFPGRRMDDGRVVAHPLYPTYVIGNYLATFRETGDNAYLTAAEHITTLARERMEFIPAHDAYAFYYEPDEKLSAFPFRFYSGLTQARYLMPLINLAKIAKKEEYFHFARQVFNSLTVPVSEGGVLLQTPYGMLVEEYPHSVPTFVLNGWTTIIVEMIRAAQNFRDPSMIEFISANLQTLESILPLYDVPFLCNSRYQLTSSCRLKAVVTGDASISLDRFSTSISGEKHESMWNVPIFKGKANQWCNFFLKDFVNEEKRVKGSSFFLNMVLSRIDYPISPEIDILLKSDKACRIEFFLPTGEYSPTVGAPAIRTWLPIGSKSVHEGMNTIKVRLPWEYLSLIGYPTNFYKKIDNRIFNAYHYLHLWNLSKIYEYSNSPVINEFFRKWKSYVSQWRTMEIYNSTDFEIISIEEHLGQPFIASPFELDSFNSDVHEPEQADWIVVRCGTFYLGFIEKEVDKIFLSTYLQTLYR